MQNENENVPCCMYCGINSDQAYNAKIILVHLDDLMMLSVCDRCDWLLEYENIMNTNVYREFRRTICVRKLMTQKKRHLYSIFKEYTGKDDLFIELGKYKEITKLEMIYLIADTGTIINFCDFLDNNYPD